MKTKAQILARLLKEKAIDEEELVILITEKQNPVYIPYPVYPNNPYIPLWPIITY